jgi:hypothetical protein
MRQREYREGLIYRAKTCEKIKKQVGDSDLEVSAISRVF